MTTLKVSVVRLQLTEEVKPLPMQNAEKDKQTAYLDLVKPRSYARAVAADNGAGVSPANKIQALRSNRWLLFSWPRQIDLDCSNILPRRRAEDKPALIIRFVSKISKGRKSEGTNVFQNGHLTGCNADQARNTAKNTWTTNCKMVRKVNGTPEEAKVLVIRSLEQLDRDQQKLDHKLTSNSTLNNDRN